MKKVEIEIRGSSLCSTMFLSTRSKSGNEYNLDIVFNNDSVKRYYVPSHIAADAIIACGDSFGKYYNKHLKGLQGRFIKTAKRAKSEKVKKKVAKTINSLTEKQ